MLKDLRIERKSRGIYEVSYAPYSGFRTGWTTLCLTDWFAKRSIKRWLKSEEAKDV
jgi:hypothetical protein